MITPGSIIRNAFVNRLGKCLFLILIFGTFPVTVAQAQDSCEVELKEADQKYRSGEFNAALALINGCLSRKEATQQDQAWAYKLLGKVYIARENTGDAKRAFRTMLELNPQMTLDATQETPEVMAIFNEVKMAFEQQRLRTGKSRKWLWIGAGGLTAAGITAAIILKGGNEEGFVPPPGRPPR